jgi:hypothetical protein
MGLEVPGLRASRSPGTEATSDGQPMATAGAIRGGLSAAIGGLTGPHMTGSCGRRPYPPCCSSYQRDAGHEHADSDDDGDFRRDREPAIS